MAVPLWLGQGRIFELVPWFGYIEGYVEYVSVYLDIVTKTVLGYC